MHRPRRKGRAGDDMPVFEVDRLPYIDAGWLELRIYRDWSRMQRWRQEAHRFVQRADSDGRETCKAYLTQALHMSYRVEKWRRSLALTQAAIVSVQKDSRGSFGDLVRERRTAANLSLVGLGRLAGLDGKTIANVERTRIFISRKTIEALLGVPELGLSWADVGLELLDENPADGRKHRKTKAVSANHGSHQTKGAIATQAPVNPEDGRTMRKSRFGMRGRKRPRQRSAVRAPENEVIFANQD